MKKAQQNLVVENKILIGQYFRNGVQIYSFVCNSATFSLHFFWLKHTLDKRFNNLTASFSAVGGWWLTMWWLSIFENKKGVGERLKIC